LLHLIHLSIKSVLWIGKAVHSIERGTLFDQLPYEGFVILLDEINHTEDGYDVVDISILQCLRHCKYAIDT
jgi:hypothetical protein